VLREGQNRLVSEFFTISALDQYDNDYPITTDDVDWSSDNTLAFDFSTTVNGDLVITAVTENESANIKASIDVDKYGLDSDDYKTITSETIDSNEIAMAVPMPRRVTSISVTGAPETVGFGNAFNVKNLITTVYDQDLVKFSDEELAAYPAIITYSIDDGGTGTVFNAATGEIRFGHTAGTVTVIAMVVNSSSGDKLAQGAVNILVDEVYTVTFNLDGGTRTSGGALTQTVSPGGAATAPVATKSNYTFTGWDKTFDNVTADITVTAQWRFTGSNGNGGDRGSGQSAVIEEPETPLVEPVTFAPFIEGFEDNTFRGNTLITREQFVAILYRLNAPSKPLADKNNPSFADVASDRWSYDATEWALEAGIIEIADGNFRPDEALTRAEMAVMLVKADKLTKMAANTFTDLAGHPDRDTILNAVEAQVFIGYPDGSFKPEGAPPALRR
jgi:hypothetical protein